MFNSHKNNVRNLKDFVFFMHKLISSDFEVNLISSFWSWVLLCRPEACLCFIPHKHCFFWSCSEALRQLKGLLGKCDPSCWSPSDGFGFVRLVNLFRERDKCVSRRRTVLTPQNSKRSAGLETRPRKNGCKIWEHLVFLPVRGAWGFD